jgi:hypothetical protein
VDHSQPGLPQRGESRLGKKQPTPFEFSGAFIKAACERAAYVAGSRNSEIDDDLLRQTMER